MQTTVKSPTKKTTKGEDVESTDPSISMEYSHAGSQASPFINAGLIIISLIAIISLSMAHGNLFLRELVISSLIVLALMFFRIMDIKNEESL